MAKRKPITNKKPQKLKTKARRQPTAKVPQISLHPGVLLSSLTNKRIPDLPKQPLVPAFLKNSLKAIFQTFKNSLRSRVFSTVATQITPQLPAVKAPTIPRAKLPKLSLPKLPSVSLPKITFPSFSLPSHLNTVNVGTKKSGVIFEASKKQPLKKRKITQLEKRIAKVFAQFKKTLAKQTNQTTNGTILLAKKAAYPFWAVVRYYPLQLFLTILVTTSVIGFYYYLYISIFKDLPSALELTQRPSAVTTKILDRNGKLLFSIYKDENRTVIPVAQVPDHVIKATVAIEDKEFYSHHGFSVRGIVRALVANSNGETVQGGSTITQQLVKNRLLSPEKTFQRKIKEVVLAVIVDGTYSKDQILEMYFNEIAYGGSTYGIESAAQQYFGKHASELTLAEGALLAGLPAAPSAYSPFGPTPELAFIRQEEVLRRMVDDGYITAEQAESAKQEVLKFRPNRVEIQAPHFVMYVRKLLAEKYGEDMITEGGLEVKTTLDLDLQNKTQEIVTTELEQLQRLRINNGAALVTNPETGEILAMVGSKDYFDFANDGQVNVTIRPRQPGSSIKPLTYATAFEHGKNPSTVEDDSPVVYQIPGSKPYAPKNYDGKFHGKVTLREALGSSYNIPAVKLLASLGLDTVINKGREMGITTWTDPTRYGLSLTLGGGEVLMIDMMKVYGTFATQGYTVETNPIMEITNYKGETLYRNECALDNVCAKKKTLDSRVAYYITDILKDNNARTPAFGPRSVLTIPGQEVAVKTGTTNNLKDNWTIGYTTNRVVATWVGNNDGSPMSYVASGVTGASPIWNDIMRLTLDDANPHTFAGPDGMIKVQICARTGTLSCRGCPAVRDEWFIPGTEPKTACNPAQFRPKPNPSASPAPNRDQILDGIFTN